MDLPLASVTTCRVIQEQRCMGKKTAHVSKLQRGTNHSDTLTFQTQVPEVQFTTVSSSIKAAYPAGCFTADKYQRYL